MLDRLMRWFGSDPDPDKPVSRISSAKLERRLEQLEREAAQADPGFRGIPLNRAGDLCMRTGHTDRALDYLGQAIDSYLEDEQPDAARAVANKLIRRHPRAVRTLCTITWLDLAGGYLGDALLHLGEYVEAARRSGKTELCRDQIISMARIIDDEQFRRTAAEGIKDLGFPEDAATIREWVDADTGPEGASTTQEVRTRCFEAAVGSNESLGGL